MAYEGQCGTCENFEESGSNQPYDYKHNADTVKGYCSWYQCYYYPDDSCRDHYKERKEPSTCYITTIVCNRMGMADDCVELETLRKFRHDVLQKDEKYKPILFEYDTVGPKIASRLQQEDMDMVQRMFTSFIQPIVGYLQKGQNEEAIRRYVMMTKSLEDYYGFVPSRTVCDGYDYTQGGHGKVACKSTKKEG